MKTESDEKKPSLDEYRDFSEEKTVGPQALILCPTRELAMQVHDSVRLVSKFTTVKTTAIVGGMASEKQQRILTKIRPEIIVATPGRFWELRETGQEYLQNLHSLKYFVVDEADRMAEKGHFAELDRYEFKNTSEVLTFNLESLGPLIKHARSSSFPRL